MVTTTAEHWDNDGLIAFKQVSTGHQLTISNILITLIFTSSAQLSILRRQLLSLPLARDTGEEILNL